MSLRKNQQLYWATFRNLKLQAWGIDQVIKGAFMITVYQVTCRPEKWAARPQMSRHVNKWEGPTAESVMQLVAKDFEFQDMEWEPSAAPRPATPSLRSATDISTGRKQA